MTADGGIYEVSKRGAELSYSVANTDGNRGPDRTLRCSKHAVDRGEIQNTDVVVLSGAGALGLGMLEFIKIKNPRLAIVLDVKDKRLEVANNWARTSY